MRTKEEALANKNKNKQPKQDGVMRNTPAPKSGGGRV